MALPCVVGLVYSVEDPSRTERLTLFQVRIFCLPFGSETWPLPRSQACWPLDGYYVSSSPGVSSPTLQNLGLISLCNHMTQLLITYIVCVYMWVCICVCVCTNMHACLVTSGSLQPHGLAHQAPLSMGFFRQGYWSE